MGRRKMARKTEGGVIRVGLHMPKTFWLREAQTLADLDYEGNKSAMVRELIFKELRRRMRQNKPTGYAAGFLRE